MDPLVFVLQIVFLRALHEFIDLSVLIMVVLVDLMSNLGCFLFLVLSRHLFKNLTVHWGVFMD